MNKRAPLPSKPEVAPGHRRGMEWKFALLGGLAASGTPRVFTAAAFERFVQRYRPGASPGTARSMARSLAQAGALRIVSNGLLLNRRTTPPAEVQEAATYIRAGAIVSLQSVLGEVGFLNNPAGIVVAVLPSSATKRPRLGEVRSSGGYVFRFHGLAEQFFPQTEAQRFQMLQPGRHCAMFRPEAALLQWLHLARMRRSSLTPPPLDVDMETLDLTLLDELAARWKLTQVLAQWSARVRDAEFGQESDTTAARRSMPSQQTIDDAAAARTRLMARRAS